MSAKLNTMMTYLKKKSDKSSSFSDFVNNASSAEKKKLYRTVLEKASDSQKRILSESKLIAAS